MKLLEEYAVAVRSRALEQALAHALFHIASLPRATPVEKLVEEIARGGYGELSKEFAQAKSQMIAGASVREALLAIGQRSNSQFVQRCMELLSSSYDIGSDLSTAFKELAEDAFDQLALAREQAAQAALQKYTVLAASAFIVPLILGLLLNVIASLDSTLSSQVFAEFLDSSAFEREQMRNAIALGSRAYLFAFALLASAFTAFTEGKRFKILPYFLALAALSQIVFTLTRSQALF